MPDLFVSPVKTAPPTVAPPAQKNSSPQGVFKSLSSFMYMPRNIRFETQEENEQIILLLRRHFITNVGWALITVLLLILPFILIPYIVMSGIVPVQIVFPYLNFILMVWYLITFTYLFSNFLLWYFNVGIITNERVLDVDFVNIMNKRSSGTRIKHIEDVSMAEGGIFRAFFNYGDVIIQTAAKEQEFQFQAIPRPDQVIDLVNKLMEKEDIKKEVM